jgi:hypothetical protein
MRVRTEFGVIQVRVVDEVPAGVDWDVLVKAGEGRYVLVVFEPEEAGDEEA